MGVVDLVVDSVAEEIVQRRAGLLRLVTPIAILNKLIKLG